MLSTRMKMLSTVVLMGFTFVSSAAAQRRGRDPLTPAEIDEIRDATQEPDQRLKLYVKFARARMDLIQQVRSDPNLTDKPRAMRERLQDFLDLYDELDDNVDMFSDRKDDIRKALKFILEADTEFQSKLRALKDSGSAKPSETGAYEFLLSNAIDAVDDGAKDHHELMSEQEELAKKKKLVKPNESR
jgi:hypothetical protein